MDNITDKPIDGITYLESEKTINKLDKNDVIKKEALTTDEINRNNYILEGRDIKDIKVENDRIIISLYNGNTKEADLTNSAAVSNFQSKNNSIRIDENNNLETFANLIQLNDSECSFEVQNDIGGYKKGDIITNTANLFEAFKKLFIIVKDVTVTDKINFKLSINPSDVEQIDNEIYFNVIPIADKNTSPCTITPTVKCDLINYKLDNDIEFPNGKDVKYDIDFNYQGEYDKYFDLIPETSVLQLRNYMLEDTSFILNTICNGTAITVTPIEGEPVVDSNVSTMSVQDENEIPVVNPDEIFKSDGSNSVMVIENYTKEISTKVNFAFRYYWSFYNKEELQGKQTIKEVIDSLKQKADPSKTNWCKIDDTTILDLVNKDGEGRYDYLLMYIPKKYSKITVNEAQTLPIFIFDADSNLSNPQVKQSLIEEEVYDLYMIDCSLLSENIQVKLNPKYPKVKENEETLV